MPPEGSIRASRSSPDPQLESIRGRPRTPLWLGRTRAGPPLRRPNPHNRPVYSFHGSFSPSRSSDLSVPLSRRALALTNLAGELDARSEAPEASGLEARGRAGLDHTAILGPDVVDGARKAAGHRDVEGGAPVAGILEKAPLGGMGVEDRQPAENLLSARAGEHPCIVGHEKVHGPRPVMAAAATGDTIGPLGAWVACQRLQAHHAASIGHGPFERAGAKRASALRTVAAVGRSRGSWRNAFDRSSASSESAELEVFFARPASCLRGSGSPS